MVRASRVFKVTEYQRDLLPHYVWNMPGITRDCRVCSDIGYTVAWWCLYVMPGGCLNRQLWAPTVRGPLELAGHFRYANGGGCATTAQTASGDACIARLAAGTSLPSSPIVFSLIKVVLMFDGTNCLMQRPSISTYRIFTVTWGVGHACRL